MANTPVTDNILASLTALNQRQESLHDLVNERHDSLRDLVTTLHNATQTTLRRHREPERTDAQPQGYADALSINVTFGDRRILRHNNLLDVPQDTSSIGGLGTRVRPRGSVSRGASDQHPDGNHQHDQPLEHGRENDQIEARPANGKGKERVTRDQDSDLDEPGTRNTARAASEDPGDYVIDTAGMQVVPGQCLEGPKQAANGPVQAENSRAKLVSQAKFPPRKKQARDSDQAETIRDDPLNSTSSHRHREVPQRSRKNDSPPDLGTTHEHGGASDAHQPRGDEGSDLANPVEPGDNAAAPFTANGHGVLLPGIPADSKFWRYTTDAPTININDLKKDRQPGPRKRSAPERYATLPRASSSARGDSTVRRGSQSATTAGGDREGDGAADDGEQVGASSRQNSVAASKKTSGDAPARPSFLNLPPRNPSEDVQSTERVARPAPAAASARVSSSTPATSKARPFKLSKALKSGPRARGRTERVADKPQGENEENESEDENEEATISPPNRHPDAMDTTDGDRYSSRRPRGRNNTTRTSLEQARRHGEEDHPEVETEGRPATNITSSQVPGARPSASAPASKKAKDHGDERATAGKSGRGKKRPSPTPEGNEDGEGEDGGGSEDEQGKKDRARHKKKMKMGDRSRLGYDFPQGFKAINR
ncbi:hypothetical protein LTS16_009851 [Friedmanniomyces endolithicus]|nr:hypothetical protein LTS16_009851 [Friedmanniomyces endolithicus]